MAKDAFQELNNVSRHMKIKLKLKKKRLQNFSVILNQRRQNLKSGHHTGSEQTCVEFFDWLRLNSGLGSYVTENYDIYC